MLLEFLVYTYFEKNKLKNETRKLATSVTTGYNFSLKVSSIFLVYI